MRNILMILSFPFFFAVGYISTSVYLGPVIFEGERSPSSDSSRDLSSSTIKQASYQIKDGYGTYNGIGSTELKAKEMARTDCVTSKIDAYEARHGQVPDVDTADMFIDACINK